MSVLGRAFGLERRALPAPLDPTALALPSNTGGSSFKQVDTNTALSIGTFYRGVELITNDLAYLPLRAMKQTASGARTPFTEATAPGIITNPFLGLTLPEGMSQLLTSLVMRGNAYLFPGKVVGGEVLQWMIVSPDSVQVEWSKDHSERVYRLGGRVYTGPVTHVAGFMLPGAPTGLSLIATQALSLGLTSQLAESASTMFANGVMASGIIGIDGPLTPDAARATAEQFMQNHSGVKKAHLPIVIGGGAKFTPLSMTPEDSQFLQSRQFQQGDIATMLGIPPHMLGIVDRTTSWGTGIEAQNRNYYDHTLKPYVRRFEHMFTTWLPQGVWASFDTDEIVRAETGTRYENYAVALNNGFLNRDEVRAREGLPPLPDGLGQTFNQSVQSAPIGEAEAAAIPTGQPETEKPATAITTGAS